jgi:hypothetical protein
VQAAKAALRRGPALGYWAARYRAGESADPLPPAGDVRMALVQAAADGARRYLSFDLSDRERRLPTVSGPGH